MPIKDTHYGYTLKIHTKSD